MTDEEIIEEGAKAFPNRVLVDMMIENLERAIKINNSGLFKVASILLKEMERRGLSTPEAVKYRRLIEYAVRKAEKDAVRH